jgi:hypothetical protein
MGGMTFYKVLAGPYESNRRYWDNIRLEKCLGDEQLCKLDLYLS